MSSTDARYVTDQQIEQAELKQRLDALEGELRNLHVKLLPPALTARMVGDETVQWAPILNTCVACQAMLREISTLIGA